MSESLRIDKWLFHARFCKTRNIAQEKAEAGRIRLNGQRVEKASANVRRPAILYVLVVMSHSFLLQRVTDRLARPVVDQLALRQFHQHRLAVGADLEARDAGRVDHLLGCSATDTNSAPSSRVTRATNR